MIRKAFKKGQYVRVLYRKYPYIGRYHEYCRDPEDSDMWSEAGHVVTFAGQHIEGIKDSAISPVEGMKGK